jgi:DNA invertase Pin-like site-specific DNA recombinase
MRAKKRPVKAYSYVRFSSPEQAKGDSLRRQLEQTAAYCAEKNLALDTSVSLRDLGLSAFKGDNVSRGNLGRFLELVDAGKVEKGSVLIIENLDRLSRAQIGDAVHLFMSILRSGVDIVTLTDRRRFSRESLNNPIELMLSIMTFYRSHDESAQKSYRAGKSWEQKRKQIAVKALTTRCPAWLTFDAATGKFVTIPTATTAVRDIFAKSMQGMGHHTIARTFNQRHISPIGRASFWHGSYVAKILKSRAVLGEFQPFSSKSGRRIPDGPCIPNYFPPVVDQPTFNAVQTKKSNRAGMLGRPTTGGMRNLFTGVARCGYCGARMQYVNKGDDSRALVCASAKRGLGCKYIGYPIAEIETTFLRYTEELDIESIVEDDGTSDIVHSIQDAEGRLVALDRQLQNLTEAIGAGTAGTAPTTVVRRISELESQRSDELKRLRKLKSDLGGRQPTSGRMKALKDFLCAVKEADATVAETMRYRLAELIRSVVAEVTLFPAGRLRGTFRPPANLNRNGPHVSRHYFVHFKNESGNRLVFSAAKMTDLGSSGRTFVTTDVWQRLLDSRTKLA